MNFIVAISGALTRRWQTRRFNFGARRRQSPAPVTNSAQEELVHQCIIPHRSACSWKLPPIFPSKTSVCGTRNSAWNAPRYERSPLSYSPLRLSGIKSEHASTDSRSNVGYSCGYTLVYLQWATQVGDLETHHLFVEHVAASQRAAAGGSFFYRLSRSRSFRRRHEGHHCFKIPADGAPG